MIRFSFQAATKISWYLILILKIHSLQFYSLIFDLHFDTIRSWLRCSRNFIHNSAEVPNQNFLEFWFRVITRIFGSISREKCENESFVVCVAERWANLWSAACRWLLAMCRYVSKVVGCDAEVKSGTWIWCVNIASLTNDLQCQQFSDRQSFCFRLSILTILSFWIQNFQFRIIRHMFSIWLS